MTLIRWSIVARPHAMLSVTCDARGGVSLNFFITIKPLQPWTDSRDCYFDYLTIPFDYLINIANSYLQWKCDFYSWKPFL